jgi:hypothetical protein
MVTIYYSELKITATAPWYPFFNHPQSLILRSENFADFFFSKKSREIFKILVNIQHDTDK